MLQRLDQLARALVPRRAQVVRGLPGGIVWRGGCVDNEEGCPFKQDGLDRTAGLGEHRQVLGQNGCVWDDGVHDSRPCLRPSVQTRGVEGVEGGGGGRSEKAESGKRV
jgi:hypothetical protein